jgi:hypothetical protein
MQFSVVFGDLAVLATSAFLLWSGVRDIPSGEPVPGLREILHRLRASRIGDTISLTVFRGGAKVDLTLSVADRG